MGPIRRLSRRLVACTVATAASAVVVAALVVDAQVIESRRQGGGVATFARASSPAEVSSVTATADARPAPRAAPEQPALEATARLAPGATSPPAAAPTASASRRAHDPSVLRVVGQVLNPEQVRTVGIEVVLHAVWVDPKRPPLDADARARRRGAEPLARRRLLAGTWNASTVLGAPRATTEDGSFSFDVSRALVPTNATLMVVATGRGGRGFGHGTFDPADAFDPKAQTPGERRVDISLHHAYDVAFTVKSGGKPVSGAEIVVDHYDDDVLLVTDARGRAEVEVDGPDVRAVVHRAGYASALVSVHGDVALPHLEVDLAPEHVLRLAARDDAGAPVPGRVEVLRAGATIGSFEIGADGTASVGRLLAGAEHTLVVDAGAAFEKREVRVTPPVASLPVQLARAAGVVVALRFDDDVAPDAVEGHELECVLSRFDEAPQRWVLVATAPLAGRKEVSFPSLGRGRYRVHARQYDLSRWQLAVPYTAPFPVESGRVTRVTLEAGHGRVIDGLVVDETGKGIFLGDGIRIREHGESVPVGFEGQLEVRLRAGDTATLEVRHSEYEPVVVRVGDRPWGGLIVLRRKASAE